MEDLVALARRQRPYIEKAAQMLSDEDAVHAVELYAEWSGDGIAYEKDHKVRYNGRVYRVITAHTSQSTYTPEAAASLFEGINETNSGTIEDPIPYSGNMALEAGKYYSQAGVTYLCTRDTINPVYHDLESLVGTYVEVAA